MTKTAFILAAGFGSRLKERTKHRPKGFLEVEGTSLIDRSVARLRAAGITKIVLGVGYRGEVYEDWASGQPDITCVRNERFA
ncbi:2-aminoethylphosphonate--pyruvate transaminase, partial [bacterium]|nr:2-aminoethylphosphonate--pyruvate transaminase [bacterium]